MYKYIVGGVLAFVLVGGGCQSTVKNAPVGSTTQEVKQVTQVTIDVGGQPFSFDPKVITVQKDDQVTINFTNKEGFHDWVLDEFNARTPQINAGATASVTFVASKVGEFEYYCSVGDHRARGMVGKLIVK